MLAAGGLLILMAMGYAVGGMVTDGTQPTDTPADGNASGPDITPPTDQDSPVASLSALLQLDDAPVALQGGDGADSLTGGGGRRHAFGRPRR